MDHQIYFLVWNVNILNRHFYYCRKQSSNLAITLLCLFTVPFNSSVRRTQVLDDESDYFATESNQWLSPGEREKLRKKEEELRELRHASRKDRKITLDFAGRQVIDEGNNLNEYYNK